MKKFHSIAIDGPSGAGKSTLSRMAAKRFSYIYVDTGAIYRSVGLYAYEQKIDTKDIKHVIAILPDINISMQYENDVQRMILNGKDVSEDIRLPHISICASNVSAIPEVREFLLNMQRDMAKKHDVIMDGRDIGTVVLPDADLKIFLTASINDRAQRRYEELVLRGVETSFDEVLRDMEYRDNNDSSRVTAPLKPADDAIIFDTSGNSLEQSYKLLCELISERFGI